MTIDSEEDKGACVKPTSTTVLADYWLGLLTPPDEEAVDAHLLECDPCGARLREVIALADGIRRVAGDIRMVVSDAYLQRAADQGLRIREYTVPRGGSVQCTVTEDDDLLVGRLTVDLSGAHRVDLSLCDGGGVEQSRLHDIPVAAGATRIAFQDSITAMKGAPTMMMVARLLALDEQGGERVLGEYTFHHTRTIPGPAAW